MASGIQHVFVLMLENRSFDHMLGFSGIKGTDALSGEAFLLMPMHAFKKVLDLFMPLLP